MTTPYTPNTYGGFGSAQSRQPQTTPRKTETAPNKPTPVALDPETLTLLRDVVECVTLQSAQMKQSLDQLGQVPQLIAQMAEHLQHVEERLHQRTESEKELATRRNDEFYHHQLRPLALAAYRGVRRLRPELGKPQQLKAQAIEARADLEEVLEQMCFCKFATPRDTPFDSGKHEPIGQRSTTNPAKKGLIYASYAPGLTYQGGDRPIIARREEVVIYRYTESTTPTNEVNL